MALQIIDRVWENTTTTGTGTYALSGARTGFQTFASGLSNADECFYCATDNTNWEVGIGTYTTSGNTLARTTVLASSNSNAAVNWASPPSVFNDLAAYMMRQLWFGLPRVVTGAAATINIGVTDRYVGVNNNSAGAVAVDLLPAASASIITVFDMGNAGANNITLTPNGADTIDGASSLVLNVNWQAFTLLPITGGYKVIA